MAIAFELVCSTAAILPSQVPLFVHSQASRMHVLPLIVRGGGLDSPCPTASKISTILQFLDLIFSSPRLESKVQFNPRIEHETSEY